jgi:hypothetical protein
MRTSSSSSLRHPSTHYGYVCVCGKEESCLMMRMRLGVQHIHKRETERTSTTEPKERKKKKKKKNWYVEQLSFYRMYYDDWLCCCSTTRVIEAAEEREWENEKERVDSRTNIAARKSMMDCQLSRSQKDRHFNRNGRDDSEWQSKSVSIKREKIRIRSHYCTIKRLFNRSIVLSLICAIPIQLTCLHRYPRITIQNYDTSHACIWLSIVEFFFLTHTINHYDHE